MHFAYLGGQEEVTRLFQQKYSSHVIGNILILLQQPNSKSRGMKQVQCICKGIWLITTQSESTFLSRGFASGASKINI